MTEWIVRSPAPSQESEWVELPPDLCGVEQARDAVRRAYPFTALARPYRNDAAFVAGELVGVGVRHAVGPLQLAISQHAAGLTVRVRFRDAPAGSDTALGSSHAWEVVRGLASSFGYNVIDDWTELWASLGGSHDAASLV